MAEESNSSSNDTLLEEAFRLIQSGNEAEDHADLWKAADCFSQAQALLSQLSASSASEDPNNNKNAQESSSSSSSKEEEDEQQQRKKIVQLYQQQSVAYLKRGRQSLVRALEEDTAADDEKDGAVAAASASATTGTSSASTDHATTESSQLLHTMTDDEVELRLRVFGRLFAREMPLPAAEQHHEEDLDLHAQESSLEARLAQLSCSLPAAAKNERERVRDLNRGLARLGLPQVGDASEQAHTGRLFGIEGRGGGAQERCGTGGGYHGAGQRRSGRVGGWSCLGREW